VRQNILRDGECSGRLQRCGGLIFGLRLLQLQLRGVADGGAPFGLMQEVGA
jgi:hypothetical protein